MPRYSQAEALMAAPTPGRCPFVRPHTSRSLLCRPADFCPDDLTAGIHRMPELVGHGGDNGQPAPVLVVRAAAIWTRMPFAAAGIGYLDARPVGSSANGYVI